MARWRWSAARRRPVRLVQEPVLDGVANPVPIRDAGLIAPSRSPVADAPRWAGRILVLSLASSALIHAGVLAALLFWPDREPVEEPGELGSVALVFDDTAARGGGAAVEQAPPPAPPSPPAPPAPPEAAQAPAPPPPPIPPPAPAASPPLAAAPAPSPPQAAAAPAPPAPPPPPVATEAPHAFAALPPDPAGTVSAPPPSLSEPVAEAAIAPPPVPEAPEVAPVAAPEPVPSEVQQAEADPLPLPPPPPPTPPQQQAAAQPPAPPSAPPPRRQAPAAAAPGPVRLDAGSGDMSDPSMGSFALGAVVPPGTDSGHRNNPPDYPAEARRRGQEGVVRLALQVTADGQVAAAEVVASSGHPALDRAAVEAARRWRFRPATRVGMPVAATLSTAVHFRLSDARGR